MAQDLSEEINRAAEELRAGRFETALSSESLLSKRPGSFTARRVAVEAHAALGNNEGVGN